MPNETSQGTERARPARGLRPTRERTSRRGRSDSDSDDADSLPSSASSAPPSSLLSSARSSSSSVEALAHAPPSREEPPAAPTRRRQRATDVQQQQQGGVLTRLRLQRAHQLRRLLSQRHAAEPEAVEKGKTATGRPGGPAFVERRSCLRDADAAMLMTFSNATHFEALLAAVNATLSGGPPTAERAMTEANPLFVFNYAMSTPESLPAPTGEVAAGAAQLIHVAQTAPAAQWRRDAIPLRRRRRLRPGGDSREGRAPAEGPGDSSRATDGGGGKAMAATGGLVARSMERWSSHLAAELGAEGMTVESFRQSNTKSGYLDRTRFQEDAQWNEYLRERRLEEAQREMAAKRAVRRGEKDM